MYTQDEIALQDVIAMWEEAGIPFSFETNWLVTVRESLFYWYELTSHDSQAEHKDNIKGRLHRLKGTTGRDGSRSLIYYILSCPEVRFDMEYDVVFVDSHDAYCLQLLIDGGKRLQEVALPRTCEGQQNIEKVELQNNAFIRITYTDGQFAEMSVHDFTQWLGISLGSISNIHYVGFTQNPVDRLVRGGHDGLGRAVYKHRSTPRDYFIYGFSYKLWAKTTFSLPSLGRTFSLLSSRPLELDADREGKFIEACTILYFRPDAQLENDIKNSEGLVRNVFEKELRKRCNLQSLICYFEEEDEVADCYNFCSVHQGSRRDHVFVVAFRQDELEINALSLEEAKSLFGYDDL